MLFKINNLVIYDYVFRSQLSLPYFNRYTNFIQKQNRNKKYSLI